MNQEKLKSLLRYDPETGLFCWLVAKAHNVKAGAQAGSPNAKGYIVIRIDGMNYRAHCLAYLYQTGFWPEHRAVHIDRNTSNNRWSNLRHV